MCKHVIETDADIVLLDFGFFYDLTALEARAEALKCVVDAIDKKHDGKDYGHDIDTDLVRQIMGWPDVQ